MVEIFLVKLQPKMNDTGNCIPFSDRALGHMLIYWVPIWVLGVGNLRFVVDVGVFLFFFFFFVFDIGKEKLIVSWQWRSSKKGMLMLPVSFSRSQNFTFRILSPFLFASFFFFRFQHKLCCDLWGTTLPLGISNVNFFTMSCKVM